MHCTASTTDSLRFPLPHAHAAFDADRRKDFDIVQSLPNPAYLQSVVRGGLPTPPADEMGTTYQQPPYNQYGNRTHTYAGRGGISQPSYAGRGHERQYSVPHSSLNRLPPPLAYVGNEGHIPSLLPYRAPSPVQSTSLAPLTTFIRTEQPIRQSSNTGDVVSKSLQIPASINNSGGSLAEFAALVIKTCRMEILQSANCP